MGTSGMYEVWMAHHAHPVLEKDWEPGEPRYSWGYIEIVSSKRKVALFMSHGVEVGSLRDTIPDLLSTEEDPDIPRWKDLPQGPPQLRLAQPRTRQHALIPGFSCSHSLFPVPGMRTWSGYTGHDSNLTNWEMHLPCSDGSQLSAVRPVFKLPPLPGSLSSDIPLYFGNADTCLNLQSPSSCLFL